MKKKIGSALVILAALVSCQGTSSVTTSSSSSGDGYVAKDPVLVDDSELKKYDPISDKMYDNKVRLPDIGGSREVPDPFIYRFNGWYYLYPTTTGGYVKAYKSQDLIAWEPVENGVLNRGYVYSYGYDGGGKPSSQTPFAPEVIYFNGKFYMIISPSGNGHYILESDSPDGPFKSITGNIGKNIDGSFFIDSEENIYLYGASSGGIIAYGMEDDFKSFVTDDSGREIAVSLLNAHVGGWNEGPYLLQRNGSGYLTYCGTHYLSSSYRVDYAYAPYGADFLKSSSYTREDNLIVSTKDSFRGLGHSATVLAPDLDSYYKVYHNLEDSNQRYLDLSRLSFNGSMMVANGVREEGVVGVGMPDFYSYEMEGLDPQGDKILSSSQSGEDFTVEFNVAGEGKMLFSYVDDANYAYIEFANNAIVVRKVDKGVEKEVHREDLVRAYATDVMHTFRLQYRQGKMNLYFDSMEKAFGIDAYFKPGKIGYYTNAAFSEIGFTAFSNVAIGSSDQKYYSDTVSLANGYDEYLSYLRKGSELVAAKKGNATQADNYNLLIKNQNDRATYRMYAPESGYYNIDLRVASTSFNKRVGIRVDDEAIIEKTLSSGTPVYATGDIQLNVEEVYLEAGQHNISIYNVGDEISFSKMFYTMTAAGTEREDVFNTSYVQTDLIKRGDFNLSNQGINTNDQDACGFLTPETYKNATAETTFTVRSLQNVGFIGLLFNVTDYSVNYSGDADRPSNPNSYRGYKLIMDSRKVYLKYNDFNFETTLAAAGLDYQEGQTYLLQLTQVNHNLQAYLNGELLFDVYANIGNLQGQIGVMSAKANAQIANFAVRYEA